MRRATKLPRELVRLAVACPRCGAGAGEACLGRAGPRLRNHQERHEAAAEAIAAERSRRGLRVRRR